MREMATKNRKFIKRENLGNGYWKYYYKSNYKNTVRSSSGKVHTYYKERISTTVKKINSSAIYLFLFEAGQSNLVKFDYTIREKKDGQTASMIKKQLILDARDKASSFTTVGGNRLTAMFVIKNNTIENITGIMDKIFYSGLYDNMEVFDYNSLVQTIDDIKEKIKEETNAKEINSPLSFIHDVDKFTRRKNSGVKFVWTDRINEKKKK